MGKNQNFKKQAFVTPLMRQQQLLNSLLVALFIVGFLIILMQELTLTDGKFTFTFLPLIEFFALCTLIVPFILNHRGYYRTASFITLSLISTSIFLLAIPWDYQAQNIGLLLYLIIPIIMGSVFHTFRVAIYYAITNLVALYFINSLFYGEPFSKQLVSYYSFLGASATLIFTSLYHRNRLEQDRQLELLKKEEKFSVIFQESPDGILVFDFTGKVLNANNAALQILGYIHRDEVIGSYHGQLFADLRKHPNFNWHKMIKGKTGAVGIKEIIRPDGKSIFLDIKTARIPWENENVAIIIFRDVTDIVRADKKLKSSLKEKEVLLQEIHHRVKNNLQTVVSLLNLQSLKIKDKKALESFEESVHRIHSMALVHEKLYRSKDLSRVVFKDYVETMVKELFEVNKTSTSVKLKLDIQKINLSIDLAIPCGLILNELVTNSLKHAFPDNRKGVIKLSMHDLPEQRYELVVQDNGIGLPADNILIANNTLGLQLVRGLTEQLHGELKIQRGNGTIFTVSFQE
jgi:PAS domain S-box-containing protein